MVVTKLVTRGWLLLLMALPLLAAAEIHSWVDENGRKHFGDRVPESYQDKSSPVTVSPNKAVRFERPDMPKPNYSPQNEWQPDPGNIYQPPHRAQANKEPQEATGTCAEQRAAFKKSAECFSRCQTKHHNGARDNSLCGHCQAVKSASCRY